MSYDPQTVTDAIDKRFPGSRDRFSQPTQSRAALLGIKMRDAANAVFPLILNIIDSPHLADDRPKLRKLGQAVQDIIRLTSNTPYASSKDSRLFVTNGTIRSYLEPEWFSGLVDDERRYIGEHVIPLTAAVPGDRFLGDPMAFLGDKFTRAMLTPQCIVTGAEDRRLDRLNHPNQSLPFLRYTNLYLSDDGETPIEVYRITDGTKINLSTYTQAEWEAELATHPLLQSGYQFHKLFSSSWDSMFQAEKSAIAGWEPRTFPIPAPPKGNFEKLDRNTIRSTLARLLISPGIPVTKRQLPAIRVTESPQRISILVLNYEGRNLFRITIGPEQKKFVLYHTHNVKKPESSFPAIGLDRLVELMAILDDRYQLHFQSRPEKKNTNRTLYWLNFNQKLSPVDNVVDVLEPILTTLVELYPSWNKLS